MRIIAIILLASCVSAQEVTIRLNRIVTGLSSPTDIQHAGDGSGRLFVAQQNGIVRVVRDGALLAEPFLDLRTRTTGGGERGLLGLAFPPGFAQKQYFYVSYTDRQGDSVIARYRVSAGNPDVADSNSERVILTLDQPFSNHNGGQIRFRRDGYLYIAFGDGGSGGDPQRHGQNRSSLLGKLLRIDVESGAEPYRVPADNPFTGDSTYRAEIWATGLRNPWRFSFDRLTDDLWIADVGQDRFEEVHFAPASSRGGENYGWNIMEGLSCFLANCDGAGLVRPVYAYGRGDGASVTGGFVYRGSRWPSLTGVYLYGDYTNGRIWSFRPQGAGFTNQFVVGSGLAISTFGEDEAGELYVADHRAGAIHRIEGTDPPQPPRLAITSAVNAASNEPGLVAGSAATIYVRGVTDGPAVIAAQALPLPLTLGGVQVTVNGVRAPLLAVANSNATEQVNFIAPFELTGPVASIVVSRDGVSSEPLSAAIHPFQPGVFAINGTDAIVVHHADNTLVTGARPLRRGEYAYLYATGLGEVDNRPATGSGGPRSPLARARSAVTVTIGGVACEVQFAGLAPDLAGVYQVNFRAGDATAGTQDLVVRAGGVASRAVRVPVE